MFGLLLSVLISQPLSFEDVLSRARTNNAALLASRAEIDVAEAELDRAWVGWQPRVDATGSLTFNSQEQIFDPRDFVPPGTMADFGEPAVIQKHVEYAGVARVSQTLFNISVLRAPGVARASRDAAIAHADAAEDELLFQAATLYATLAGLKAQEAAADRALAVAEQRVADARVQVDAGRATPLVLTRAETDRVVALGVKASLLAARRGAAANLGAMIGAKGAVEISEDRLSDSIKTAPAERAIVVAREREAIAAEKAIGLTSANWLPSLAAEGTARYSNASGFAESDFNARATINLVIPIYDGERYAATDVAEARAVAARHRLEDERAKVRAYLESASAELDAAKAELEQAEAQLRLANETVKQTEELAGSGLATNLELTDADARRFSADRAYAQKRLDLELAVLRVHYAAGGRLTSQ